MLMTSRKISSILVTCLLTWHLGACSSQENTTEESIQSSDEFASAEAPVDVEKTEADRLASSEKDKALAEASSSDFQDPSDVQLNETMNSPAASAEAPSASTDAFPVNDTAPVATAVDDVDNSIPAPVAPDLMSDSSAPVSSTGIKIYFGKNSSRISKEFRSQLRELAAKLKADKSLTVTVSGHCDNRGSPSFNRRLAMKRAKAVKAFLVRQSVASKQVKVLSFGKDHLVAAGQSEQDHSLNRRVEIEFP